MNGKIFIKRLRGLALLLTALAVLATPSFSATINLVAEEATLTINGTVIPMWGFFEDTACNGTPRVWTIGPQINVGPADTSLTVTLLNCLAVPTSLVITGQAMPADGVGAVLAPTTMTDPQGRVRVTSFTQNAASAGGSMTYTWTGLKDGTYLYHSGTHAALQQHMGLYGAARVEQVAGLAYGVAYQQEQVLFYSEIDPALHAPPAVAKPLNYKPRYFLVNGQPFTGGTLPVGNITETSLLRLLNAGLKTHVPTLLKGYLQVLAEDGNAYPYVREQYSLQLAAGETRDALFSPSVAGTYPLFDGSLHLTTNGATGGGMYSLLTVADVAGLPVANAGPDQAGISVGATVTLDGSGSFDPDSLPGPLTYLWSFTSVPAGSSVALSDPTLVGPTFTADLAGTYVLDLVVNDGATDSAADSVSITTNLAPVANAGPDQLIAATTPTPVTLDGSGSFDPDALPGPLTYSWSFVSRPATSTAVLAGPTSVNSGFTADPAGDYVVQLIVNDGALGSAADMVTITLTTNLPPIANAGLDSTVLVDTPVTLDGSGSSDPDAQPGPLTYSWSFVSTPFGNTATLADPTLANPVFTPDVAGAYVLQLIVYDGADSSAADTVTITVNPNLPPVAVDDTATTPQLTPVTIDLVANDSDLEGALDPTSVVITSQPTRGGSVVNMGNGTVIYTPRRGFKGTDIFTYTVSDLVGNLSNEATVRVNVVR